MTEWRGRLYAGNLGSVERELNLNIHGRHVWFGDTIVTEVESSFI